MKVIKYTFFTSLLLLTSPVLSRTAQLSFNKDFTHHYLLSGTDISSSQSMLETDASLSLTSPNLKNKGPKAKAGNNQKITDADGDGKETVQLDGSDSSDKDGSIVSYFWSIEGSGSELASGISPLVELPLGSTTIELTVTDDGRLQDTDKVKITIAEAKKSNKPTNKAPKAIVGRKKIKLIDSDNDGKERVELDGSKSHDSDGSIESYTWTIAGTSTILGQGEETTVELPLGTTNIVLTVTDDGGLSASDQLEVEITAAPQETPVVTDPGEDEGEEDEGDSPGEGVEVDDPDDEVADPGEDEGEDEEGENPADNEGGEGSEGEDETENPGDEEMPSGEGVDDADEGEDPVNEEVENPGNNEDEEGDDPDEGGSILDPIEDVVDIIDEILNPGDEDETEIPDESEENEPIDEPINPGEDEENEPIVDPIDEVVDPGEGEDNDPIVDPVDEVINPGEGEDNEPIIDPVDEVIDPGEGQDEDEETIIPDEGEEPGPDEEVVEAGSAFLPNLFSPNGDQMNDTFVLQATHISRVHLRVFNKQGKLVFETRDVREASEIGWDGTAFGQAQPEGSYFWVIEGTFSSGAPLTIDGKNTGGITLIR